jgi:alginate O-acetyltransferase complex protein AlgI
MIFSSVIFFVFFFSICALHWLSPHKYKNLVLLFSSYYFYSLWGSLFVVLLFISTIVDYSSARLIYRFLCDGKNKVASLLLYISIFINLSLLILFKYCGIFNSEESLLLDNYQFNSVDYAIPIGISFYTFQTMGYTIDVYRKLLKPENNFINYALFVAFFPQVLAGPIERGGTLLPQIRQKRQLTYRKAEDASCLIIWGLFLKVVISDNLSPLVTGYFNSPSSTNPLVAVSTWYSCILQIYADFAGYSYIAVGVGGFFGFKLTHNFMFPFFSTGPQEFFSKWHISLVDWFKRYLFKPLSKKLQPLLGHKLSLHISEAVVLISFAIWHGLNITFFLWGLILIFIFNIYRFLGIKYRLYNGFKRLIYAAIWFHILALAGLVYRSPNLSDVPIHLLNIFSAWSFKGIDIFLTFLTYFIFIICVEYPHHKNRAQMFFPFMPTWFRLGFSMVIMMLIITMGSIYPWNFVYFEF